MNKILRRYISKSPDVSWYSKYFIKKLEEKVHRRFMECLGFLTPDEAYERESKRKSVRVDGGRKKEIVQIEGLWRLRGGKHR